MSRRVDDVLHRTNNSVEGWRRAFQSSLSYAHPSLWKLIDHIVTAKSITVPPQHRRVYYLIILVIYTASVKSAMYSGRTSPLVVYSARRAVAKVNVGLEKVTVTNWRANGEDRQCEHF